MIWTFLSVAIAAIITALLGVFIWRLKKNNWKHEPDYRGFALIGLIWIIISGGYSLIRGTTLLSSFFAMGFIFFIIGMAKRNKWKNSKPLTPNQKIAWYAIMTFAVVLVVAMYIFLP